MNQEFKDSTQTPLTENGLENFKKLKFFKVKYKYYVKATLLTEKNPEVFEMQRSKGNTGTYRKYGVLVFQLKGREYRLSVYQLIKLLDKEEFKDHLFLPFKDKTNGRSTYGGGRYIDLKIPEDKVVYIDFNQAYNPLCSYHNPKYSCPLPPEENHLCVKIMAGEKLYRGK